MRRIKAECEAETSFGLRHSATQIVKLSQSAVRRGKRRREPDGFPQRTLRLRDVIPRELDQPEIGPGQRIAGT